MVVTMCMMVRMVGTKMVMMMVRMVRTRMVMMMVRMNRDDGDNGCSGERTRAL